ncbi:MAG: cytochrome ubiquinol oxidase subunit I [Gemmatimonadales bacterium]
MLRAAAGAAALLLLALEPGLAQEALAEAPAYGDFPLIGARGAIWIAAQVHLMFAAFVLGVPMFAVVVEAIGIFGGDERYDKLAKEFTRLLVVAYSATAIWGAILVFGLATLYPRFWAYLTTIFAPSMWVYAGLFFLESFTLYLYYYGWDRWKKGLSKRIHLGLGVALNVWGTIVMFIANSWLTFMMSPPRDLAADTAPQTVRLWSAIANATWMPINVHRLIANVVFGGAVVGAYAAYRFLASCTDEERAHYDWMGYVGNFIAIGALIVLPFAGYYLGREIYEFNQQMGITMMGGFMSWLWIIQAFLIGVLFLTGNYYLWVGMGRIPGAERFSVQGVMSAKNTAVNLMILTTFLSFLLYRRANKQPIVSWARTGTMLQGAAFVLSAAVVLFYGIYGYFVTAIVRIGFSVYQVLAVLACIFFVIVLDVFMMRGATSRGAIRWGQMPARSQYALFILAVTFTWLMGLMGFARSGIRQHWHVFEVIRDTSPQAFTPALGPAATMISICVLIFFALVGFIFWLGGLAEKPAASPVGEDGSYQPDDPPDRDRYAGGLYGGREHDPTGRLRGARGDDDRGRRHARGAGRDRRRAVHGRGRLYRLPRVGHAGARSGRSRGHELRDTPRRPGLQGVSVPVSHGARSLRDRRLPADHARHASDPLGGAALGARGFPPESGRRDHGHGGGHPRRECRRRSRCRRGRRGARPGDRYGRHGSRGAVDGEHVPGLPSVGRTGGGARPEVRRDGRPPGPRVHPAFDPSAQRRYGGGLRGGRRSDADELR